MGIIRLLFAIAVVLAHTTPMAGVALIGSVTAVQSFFILSGFYMSLILKEKYFKKKNSYSLFFSNRLLKLFPTHVLILLCIVVFSLIQYYISRVTFAFGGDYGQLSAFYNFKDQLSLGTTLYLIFTNLFIIGQDTILFLGLGKSGNLYFTPNYAKTYPQLHYFLLNPVMWVVSLEILFYFLAPFLVNKNTKFLAILGGISVGIRITLSYFGYRDDPWGYRFFPSELVFFTLGIFSYRFYDSIRNINANKKIIQVVYLLFITLIIFFQKINIPDIFYYISLVILIPFIFLLFKNSKIDRYFGELSYPIYVSHLFLLSIILFFKLPLLYNTAITLVIVSTIFSALLKYFILDKIEKFRQRRVAIR